MQEFFKNYNKDSDDAIIYIEVLGHVIQEDQIINVLNFALKKVNFLCVIDNLVDLVYYPIDY